MDTEHTVVREGSHPTKKSFHSVYVCIFITPWWMTNLMQVEAEGVKVLRSGRWNAVLLVSWMSDIIIIIRKRSWFRTYLVYTFKYNQYKGIKLKTTELNMTRSKENPSTLIMGPVVRNSSDTIGLHSSMHQNSAHIRKINSFLAWLYSHDHSPAI